jgi:hypothetical protein
LLLDFSQFAAEPSYTIPEATMQAAEKVSAALESLRSTPEKLDGKPVAYLGRLEFTLCNRGSC